MTLLKSSRQYIYIYISISGIAILKMHNRQID
jgi:hypothetical protein